MSKLSIRIRKTDGPGGYSGLVPVGEGGREDVLPGTFGADERSTTGKGGGAARFRVAINRWRHRSASMITVPKLAASRKGRAKSFSQLGNPWEKARTKASDRSSGVRGAAGRRRYSKASAVGGLVCGSASYSKRAEKALARMEAGNTVSGLIRTRMKR